jgi:hypothetical protein
MLATQLNNGPFALEREFQAYLQGALHDGTQSHLHGTHRFAQKGMEELDKMHALYQKGRSERHMAPHIVYADALCPHPGCGHPLQVIDFRLEAYGQAAP